MQIHITSIPGFALDQEIDRMLQISKICTHMQWAAMPQSHGQYFMCLLPFAAGVMQFMMAVREHSTDPEIKQKVSEMSNKFLPPQVQICCCFDSNLHPFFRCAAGPKCLPESVPIVFFLFLCLWKVQLASAVQHKHHSIRWSLWHTAPYVLYPAVWSQHISYCCASASRSLFVILTLY